MAKISSPFSCTDCLYKDGCSCSKEKHHEGPIYALKPVASNVNNPRVLAVLGAQWGDEGKGKLVNMLAKDADVCCRFNGGSNAGHTIVVNDTRYALHLIPCGILHSNTLNFIGNGVVLHLKTLMQELEDVKPTVPDAVSRLYISSRAHLLFDFHQYVDVTQETQKATDGGAIGTTRRGIGPCYTTKAARLGVRVCDLLDWDIFEKKYRNLLENVQSSYGVRIENAEEELQRHKTYAEILRPQIVDGVHWLHCHINAGKKILIEGANACLLDLDFGTYPFVTSSSTTAGGMCTGLGLPPQFFRHIIGVVKAYTTRVGLGPFPTELHDTTAEIIRKQGAEFGTTTGRPRRCGWLDIPLIQYSIQVNGLTLLNLTKLDVLSGLKSLKLCVAYRDKTTGAQLDQGVLPSLAEYFDNIEPIYETLPGWSASLVGCRTYKDLPQEAKNYICRVEQLLGRPIEWVGVGPDALHTLRCNAEDRH